jgi:Icc-related predicted phosphoesterase
MFLFASDLHGHDDRYEKLFTAIERERPEAVLLGGDLLPFAGQERFLETFEQRFEDLSRRLNEHYPPVLLILGNDDPRVFEESFRDAGRRGLWTLLHNCFVEIAGVRIYGYPYVPPTPFTLKDWERYDVSHYVDPGCLSPEEGGRSVAVDEHEVKYSTIESDLRALAGDDDVGGAVFLFHTPPYGTALDRAALDGKTFDHVPVDVHVGSIAVRRFIESRQPRVTLHGHVHESARLTGMWSDRIGRTVLLGAAHDGPELALVRFDPRVAEQATRELL